MKAEFGDDCELNPVKIRQKKEGDSADQHERARTHTASEKGARIH